ncbi:MAG: hypothetical protein ACI9S8_002495 [Chlamydiales bacterium]|jgi:hypothetical protein
MAKKIPPSKSEAYKVATAALFRAQDRVRSGVDIREIKISRDKGDSNKAAVKALMKASLKHLARRYGEKKI